MSRRVRLGDRKMVRAAFGLGFALAAFLMLLNVVSAAGL